MCRQAYARSAPNVDILLLSRDGHTVYNGPLRLTVPYFLSIGLGGLGRGCTEDALLDIVSSPEASTPLLDGQVRPAPTIPFLCVHRCIFHVFAVETLSGRCFHPQDIVFLDAKREVLR